MQESVPLDVADVESCPAVQASPPSHQLFKEDVVSESDVEDAMDWELFDIFVKLTLSARKSIQDNSFGWLWLFNLFIYDLDDNLIADKPTWLDNSPDCFDQVLVKGTADSSFQNFSNLIASRHMVEVQILSEKLDRKSVV